MVNPIALAIGVGACAVIAAGIIYFAFFDKEEEECYKHGPSGSRRPRSSNRLPLEVYEPPPSHGNDSSRNNPPARVRGSEVRRRSVTSQQTPNINEQNNPDRDNFRTTRPTETQSTSNSSLRCRVCDEIANAKFLPCGHFVFCYKDANYFWDLPQNEPEMRHFTPKCPNCRREIKEIA